MNVIRHATNAVGFTSKSINRAAQIFVKPDTYFLIKPWLAMFGAEYDVVMQA